MNDTVQASVTEFLIVPCVSIPPGADACVSNQPRLSATLTRMCQTPHSSVPVCHVGRASVPRRSCLSATPAVPGCHADRAWVLRRPCRVLRRPCLCATLTVPGCHADRAWVPRRSCLGATPTSDPSLVVELSRSSEHGSRRVYYEASRTANRSGCQATAPFNRLIRVRGNRTRVRHSTPSTPDGCPPELFSGD